MRFRPIRSRLAPGFAPVPLGLALLGTLALALGACSTGYRGPHGVAEVYLEAGRHQDAAREAEKELRLGGEPAERGGVEPHQVAPWMVFHHGMAKR